MGLDVSDNPLHMRNDSSNSSTDSGSGRGRRSQLNELNDLGDVISDEKLASLDIKDLNRFLRDKGLSKDVIEKLKQRRRTLKNRKYATDCREKKDTEVIHLQGKQFSECSTIEELEIDNVKLQKEIDDFKKRYQALVRYAKSENIPITERNIPITESTR